MGGMSRLALVAVLVVTAAPAHADEHPHRIALELSPMSIDAYMGGEYVAHEFVSSTVVGIAYEGRLARHLAVGAVVSYVQPGSQILPLIKGPDLDPGNFSTDQVRASGRMVAAQARVRLVFPLPGDAVEVGVGAQAGPSFLWFPGGYRGSGAAADVGVDVAWFWSRWGAGARASVGLSVTGGTSSYTGSERNAAIDRVAMGCLTLALVRKL